MTTRYSPRQRAARRAALKPGTYGNPHPLKEGMSPDDSLTVSHTQRRYHGTTMIIAHRKGYEPDEYRCAMRGHVRKMTGDRFTEAVFDAYKDRVGPTRRGSEWYTNPIKATDYDEFMESYVLFEHYDAYTD